MITRPTLFAITLLGCHLAAAQDVREEPENDPVLDAIQKFKSGDKTTPNEIKVTLDDVGKAPAATAVKDDTKPTEPKKTTAAVLVTGKPPESAKLEPEPQNPVAPPADEEPPKPENGLAVRVEKLQSGDGSVDPSQVKLTAPFPAKPLAAAPLGWCLDPSDIAPPFTREVELYPGAKVTLSIRPHILVPEADGVNIFTIFEPGYRTSQGYQQSTTVGAILSHSIRQLDEDSKQLGTVMDSLNQLLSSLPKPEPQIRQDPKPAGTRKK